MKRLFYMLIFSSCFFARAQQVTPLNQKALVLKRFLEKNHYQPLVWNDSSSERLYNKWIGFLDREKLFFTRADIATLETYKTTLDDEMKGGSWKFFTASASLYRKRLLKVDSLVKNVLANPIVFTTNESLQLPFADFAPNEADLQQRWKKYCKWQVHRKVAESNDSINISPAEFTAAEKKAVALQKVQEERYMKRLLGNSLAEFTTALEDNYLNCIAWCYDPHTSYMNMAKKEAFETEMSASEYSVGFEITENDKEEQVVSFLQPGGSAWRSGELHKGDVLVAVKIGNQFKSITDLTSDELEEALGGTSRAATELRIRTLAGEIKTVKLNKEKISNEEDVVKSYVLAGNTNIGYINLPGFYSRENLETGRNRGPNYDGCANDVSKEIVKLKKDSISGLILDLRYNGGGSIWEAMQLAGIFIDFGPVASMKDRDGKVQFLKDPNRGTIYDGPLMVLINGASASASEFVSAVLQDYHRAIIVGGTTYGKGTAQVVLPMDTGTINPNKKYEDFVKVTGQKFYRVNGSTTQWIGTEPDIVLPDVYDNDAYKEKSVVSALQPDRSKTGVYPILPELPITDLGSKSAKRVTVNPFFQSVQKYLDLTAQYQKSRTIALTWPAYLVQYKAYATLMKSLDEAHTPNAGNLAVRNNSFDAQRISLLDGHNKDVNETYLENVGKDPVIMEARAIMLDWSGKK